jgi:hypothetical protein
MGTNIGICTYMFSYILAHDLDHQRRQCAETCLFDLNRERLLSGSGHRNLNIECVPGALYRPP